MTPPAGAIQRVCIDSTKSGLLGAAIVDLRKGAAYEIVGVEYNGTVPNTIKRYFISRYFPGGSDFPGQAMVVEANNWKLAGFRKRRHTVFKLPILKSGNWLKSAIEEHIDARQDCINLIYYGRDPPLD